MSIRVRALAWLAKNSVRGGHVVASKRYGPEESWTKSKAWWLQVPLSALERERTIHLVCEADDPAMGFHHLQVPSAFLKEHLGDFALIGDDKINLILAIERGIEFQDQRGPGKVRLAQFEISPSAA